MRIYFGTIGWGWKMYGIGYKAVWFCGFSIAIKQTTANDEIVRLRDLIDIAYDHLRGAGYEPEGVTLKQLETGCNPAIAQPETERS